LSSRFTGGSQKAGPPALEAQQELVIKTLRRAGQTPVTYAELRRAGIELPASVISELELAGMPIERCYGGAHGERRVVGVRLAEPTPGESVAEPTPGESVAEPSPGESVADPTPWEPVAEPTPEEPVLEPAPESEALPQSVPGSTSAPAPALVRTSARTAASPAGRWNPVVVYRPWAADRRLLAPLALAVAAVIVAVLVLTGLGGGNAAGPRTASAPRTPAKSRAAATPSATARHATTTTPASVPAPRTPVSSALATQLEGQGHSLLNAGRYAGAIPVLRRALAATGEQTNACLEPISNTCLTYAYALYDLGRALRLSGDSAAAVPILEARLQIDNQRPTVAAELQLARERAA
jgi:hypothetical protein